MLPTAPHLKCAERQIFQWKSAARIIGRLNPALTPCRHSIHPIERISSIGSSNEHEPKPITNVSRMRRISSKEKLRPRHSISLTVPWKSCAPHHPESRRPQPRSLPRTLLWPREKSSQTHACTPTAP